MSEISLSPESSAAGSQPATRAIVSELVLTSHEWGMLAFLVSEAAFFCTLIVVYLAFVGAVQSGPTPAILSLPLVIGMTVCLLSSSVTVHLAATSLRIGAQSAFLRWWSATILLGIAFLAGTGWEWTHLIGEHGLTISRNIFGTTYYTLVGFHGLHVTVGVIAMLILLAFARPARPMLSGSYAGRTNHRATAGKQVGVELVSWYWHFVDVVWVVVFTVVYVVGR
jgi:cytochrome c oxidase subunit 3